ncbi:hypothetical protein H9Y04_07110 [Streptomyces sp. TRM66268-LWL]|uniref:non-specific serine/threonine protein kinase n=1 Tax=Streptomyces polyasparticus TaxID=2767826 RepID=A0ABR7SA40_9ACTN|nr:hypothetical protein [Streptomyces polyasparticus]MBC9712341.1 hypothetical protein [Streptomyces polyasparticus]
MRGALLGGRFRLARRIGKGGMGSVREAVDEHMQRPVAVELVTEVPGMDERETAVRFRRECARSRSSRAKFVGDTLRMGGLTGSGGGFGMYGYMAPEQIRGGRPVDHCADLYALGCVLHFLLAGRPPFTGTNAASIGHAQLHEPLVPVRQSAPHVAEGPDASVTALMAREPAHRPQPAAEANARADEEYEESRQELAELDLRRKEIRHQLSRLRDQLGAVLRTPGDPRAARTAAQLADIHTMLTLLTMGGGGTPARDGAAVQQQS